MNAITASTQDALIDGEVQAHLKERALELMQDARNAGFVINLTMPTDKQKAKFNSQDGLVIAPNGKPGKTILHPEPDTTGQRYTG
jgi:hypothetical protein